MRIISKKSLIIFLLISGVVSIFLVKNYFSAIDKQEKEKQEALEDPLRWQEIVPSQDYWSGRDSHSVVVFKDKILLFGGVEGGKVENSSPIYETMPHKSDVWRSSEGKNWELVEEDAPWGGRRSMASIVFKEKLFLFGGWKQEYGETLNDVWYTEDGKEWNAEKSAAWPAREGAGIVVFRDKIWIAGGVNYFNRKTMNDVWYTEDGISWTQASDSAPWAKRYDHSLTVFKGKLWLIGGMDFGNKIYKDVWVSENGIDWKLASDQIAWPPRHGHAALEYKDSLWVMGGWCELPFQEKENGGGLDDVWYTEDGISWTQIKNAPWSGREDLAGIVYNDKIFIMGGMADEGKDWAWKKDIWQAQ